jgi:SAM-dependent methyltransferase
MGLSTVNLYQQYTGLQKARPFGLPLGRHLLYPAALQQYHFIGQTQANLFALRLLHEAVVIIVSYLFLETVKQIILQMQNNIPDNWYENFFQGLTCEIWENAIPPAVTKAEVDFLETELNLQPGQNILDIPCGYGRHAVEFARRGYAVTAIDISETFMKTLQQQIAADNLNINPVTGNILKIELDEKFSGAVCLGNSFGYFDIEHMQLFIQKVAASLNKGAKFIINSGMVAESILPNLPNYAKNKLYNIGDITMEVTNVYHTNESYLVSNLLYTKENKQEQTAFKHYVFTLGEITRLLATHGLSVVATYNSIAKDVYNAGDQQVYIVAEKN